MENCKAEKYKKSVSNENLEMFGYIKVGINNFVRNSSTDIAFSGGAAFDAKIVGATFVGGGTKISTTNLSTQLPNGTYTLYLGKYGALKYANVRDTPNALHRVVSFNVNDFKFLTIEDLEIPYCNVVGNVNSLIGKSTNCIKKLNVYGTNIENDLEDIATLMKPDVNCVIVVSAKTFGDMEAAITTMKGKFQNGKKVTFYNIIHCYDNIEWGNITPINGNFEVVFDGQGGYTINTL